MNIDEIMEILPHRKPMLLVDEAILDGEDGSIGYYQVKGDEFFLQGHFPGNPIVPGVILCEMMAQAACVIFKDKMNENVVPVYTGLDKVRFKNMVKPGDRVCIHTKLTGAHHPLYKLHGEIFVGDKLCTSGDFSFALKTEEGN